jgi:hypothetical protein
MVSDLNTADATGRFRLVYDVAISRCGICERCGEAPVSKALRIQDPIEGPFDSPSNLLAWTQIAALATRAASS